MELKKSLPISILAFILISGIVLGVSQVYTDYNFNNNNIINASDVNASNFYQAGKIVCDSSDNCAYISDSQESNLNVNSSNYWDNLNTPSDILFSDLSPSNIDITNYNITANYFKGSVDSSNIANEGNLNVNSSDYLDGKDGTYYLDDTDTNASTACSGTGTYLSGDGTCESDTQLTTEQVQDDIGAMVGSHLTYTDATPDLSVDDDWVDIGGDTMSGNLDLGDNKLTSTGQIETGTGDKHCLDGSTCSHYIQYNGTHTIIA